jgi:cytochrome b561
MGEATSTPGGAAGRIAVRGSILGWVLFVVACNILYIATQIPETAVGSPGRTVVDKMHLSWGVTAFILVVVRLYFWWKTPPVAPDPNMPGWAWGLSRDVSLAFYLALLIEGVVGPMRSWGEGYEVALFGFALPALFPPIYEVRVIGGYFHSAVAFFVAGMLPFGVVMALVVGWRTKVPFYRLFPV